MEQESEIVVLIPARGGSKSIPLKNIKQINGRPLIFWTIDAAVNCRYIDKIYIATDNILIKDAVLDYKDIYNVNEKLECISRSKKTATDIASTESVMIEFANKYDFSKIILIQATNPLLTTKDLDNAIIKYKKEGYDSLLSVVRQKRFIWNEKNNSIKPYNYNPLRRPRRQEFDGFLVENGSFYITKRKLLLNTSCRISGDIGYYEMNDESYFEIDEPSDWVIIDNLLRNKYKKNNDYIIQRASKIKLLLTDSDGVLTDGGMYYSENGDELKKFNTKDGMGFQLLREKGIITGIITGENRELVRRRARKLNVDEVFLGIKDKLNIIDNLKKKYDIEYEEIAYIGDDINDLEVIKKVGLGCAVSDAMEIIKNSADFITKTKGGYGAVREVAEIVLSKK